MANVMETTTKLARRVAARPEPHPGEPVDYQRLTFTPSRRPEQDAPGPARHPVVIVGAGPVGLSLAIDLAQRDVPVLLLDSDNTLSTGSRAICFAKRSLEIFDRLGCGDRVAAKGVSWNVGKVFFRDDEIYRFDLLEEKGQERPAFVNLQQYYVEGFLVERAAELPAIDIRWMHRVTGLEQHVDGAVLTVDTPDGAYAVHARFVVACDGSRSTLRELLGEQTTGQVFRDRFLIADVRMTLDWPAERWFWFDPPFHPDKSVLLHMQPDSVWRIDFQLGWEADPEEEKKPENIIARVRALLGVDVPFELEWASVYTFACTRMAAFRRGSVLFAGDAAHGVSPFGARGANSGVQDADNLGWKLAAVLRGEAPDGLLDSYASEREAAADENIRHSTRATDFITPKSAISRLFRDAVLELSRDHLFARRLVNSGRLSTASELLDSPLNSADEAEPECDRFNCAVRPGCVAVDAPVTLADGRSDWLLRRLGRGFTLLVCDDPAGRDGGFATADVLSGAWPTAAGAPPSVLQLRPAGCTAGAGAIVDTVGSVAERYDLRPGSAYLFRPDQHICARWRRPTADAVRQAVRRALAVDGSAARVASQ